MLAQRLINKRSTPVRGVLLAKLYCLNYDLLEPIYLKFGVKASQSAVGVYLTVEPFGSALTFQAEMEHLVMVNVGVAVQLSSSE